MSFIARKDPWQEQLWNVSLLPASMLPPAGKPDSDPTPEGTALGAPATLSRYETQAPASDAEAA
jgi:hypothetical protein